uniref:Core shell protein Gag P30 domain-containing protein n=1 Tax=Macaca fascicularis TaxID=9541 RepID=A0A7N9IH54_MACFA
MGNTQASTGSPLKCILSHWDQSDLQTLKKRQLISFCTTAWPQYSLSDGEKWPPQGSINYNTILQLDLFCKREGKWSEIPYVQAFFSLKENTQLCKPCNLHPTGGPFSLSPYPSLPIAPLPINDKPPLNFPAQKEISKEISKGPQKPPGYQSCPLQAVGEGEFGPTQVHVPFSLSDLKQIKADLGKFSDDPDRYTDVLQGLGQTSDLIWRDVMLLLDHTLAFNEKNVALAAAREFRDTWYLTQVNDRMTAEERDKFPTSQQAVPSMDPHWDLDSDRGDWSLKHLLTCVLQGLRRIRKKSINYSMMYTYTITQGKEENYSAFLEQLREALRKYTPLSPDSLKGQLIRKDKFITQSATDIRRKFQKRALGPEQNLDALLNLATSVFYNRDQEEEAQKEKQDQRKAAVLVMALRQTNLGGFREDRKRSRPITR